MLTQILVPLDGSEFAERALPYVEEVAAGLRLCCCCAPRPQWKRL
jgi:ferredoxin